MIDPHFLSPIDVWSLVDYGARVVNVTYPDVQGEVFHQVVFTVHLSRKPGFFMVTILYPTSCLTALLFGGAFMSPKSSDRPVFILTVVLSLSITLSMTSDLIPQSSHIPAALLLLSAQLGVAVICTFYSLVVLELAKRKSIRRRKFGQKIQISLLRALDIGFFLSAGVVLVGVSAFFLQYMLRK